MSEDAKAPDMVVLDHHHDSAEKVYRLTIGLPVEVQRPKFDDDGNPVFERVPLIGQGGEIMKDFDGKEIYLCGQQEIETVTDYVEGPNYVFASDDKRYKDKTPEQIAKLQRADVRKQIKANQAEAKKTASRPRNQLPGSGDAL